jgi:hypothetical protein
VEIDFVRERVFLGEVHVLHIPRLPNICTSSPKGFQLDLQGSLLQSQRPLYPRLTPQRAIIITGGATCMPGYSLEYPRFWQKKLIHILIYVYMLLFNWTKRQKPTNKQLSGSRAGQQLTRPKRPPPVGNLTFIQNHESHELLLLVPSQGHWN